MKHELPQINQIEISLLAMGIKKRYGYDFSHYSYPMLERQVNYFLEKLHIDDTASFIHYLLTHQEAFRSFLDRMSVTVTSFFRDPDYFIFLKKTVIPYLKTYPSIKIWHRH